MMEKKEKKGEKKAKKSKNVFSADSRKFSGVKVAALMDYVNNDLTVENGNEIPQILQNMEFQIGRIELIAAELSSIANVFDCVFEFDNADDSVTITSDFVSRTQTAKLRSVFTLPDEEYPFTPMQACFESVIGGINTVHLGQSLARNVDPGYGYLRRAFDTVSAFLK
ncbi:hypothetical protein TL16_g01392 [Triparma laevis f. inornata]|nr:hypothetical protein TL16_g01392 [Triparma laevis f. inornata]